MGRRELAENDPIKDLYNHRCSVIRTKKSRDTITEEFAQAAKKLAKEHTQRAFQDDAYDHGLSSPSSADRIYRKALEKMRKFIREQLL